MVCKNLPEQQLSQIRLVETPCTLDDQVLYFNSFWMTWPDDGSRWQRVQENDGPLWQPRRHGFGQSKQRPELRFPHGRHELPQRRLKMTWATRGASCFAEEPVLLWCHCFFWLQHAWCSRVWAWQALEGTDILFSFVIVSLFVLVWWQISLVWTLWLQHLKSDCSFARTHKLTINSGFLLWTWTWNFFPSLHSHSKS